MNRKRVKNKFQNKKSAQSNSSKKEKINLSFIFGKAHETHTEILIMEKNLRKNLG